MGNLGVGFRFLFEKGLCDLLSEVLERSEDSGFELAEVLAFESLPLFLLEFAKSDPVALNSRFGVILVGDVGVDVHLLLLHI